MSSLKVQNATVQIGEKTLLDDVSITVTPGEVVTVLGPNGAGKSTLMKVISGERKPSSGSVILNDREDWRLEQQALMLGVLPQSSSLSFPFTVEEVVILGRIPCATDRTENLAIVEAALNEVDGLHLKDRQYTTLSGGERQRVHMARVLAQIWNELDFGKRYLLLDEPTSALDPAHQQLTLKMARKQAEKGVGVLVILHDLNLAARYSDRLVILKEGGIAAQGTPHEVLTVETVKAVFNVDVTISEHPAHHCPLVINN
ncbi:heme ABC transporter ATP-binding protein [Endozoicomonas numazuensis]|uniref:Hemin ABC transporter ATP-binding protein n=1 Tax=Endozoicomonas numazuensis TaxID=1137799 RepID=A0A081NDB6_9GAMM|nr:heme ABC transporter ATP-binding protein [Endozoicomonas numazuensis]KEQ16439.1 hemin ABC transporter ATP-binding protein [Endozoicomonas numazuensis]